jgi:hypothetical protein
MKKTILITVAGSIVLTGTSMAAWIMPAAATATSEQGSATAARTLNPSDLTAESIAGLHTAGATSSWSFAQGNGINNDAEYITFDLGGAFDLTDLHVWQFTRDTVGNDENRGVSQFDVLVSSDNVSFTEVLSNLTLSKAIDTTPDNGLPDGNEPVQSFGLAQTGVSYVRLAVDSTFEGGAGRDWQGGFGEVRFEGAAVAAVPEPSATALLGLGGLALMLRRRR